MKILLPIAPQDALRQSPSLETGTTPEGEGTGFAEALTAALAAPVSGEARPTPTATASPQIDGGAIEAASEGGDGALPFGKNQPPDGTLRPGDTDPGLKAQTGPYDPSLHDGAADYGTDGPLPNAPGRNLTGNADVDGADIRTQTAKVEVLPSGQEEGRIPAAPGHALDGRVGDAGDALIGRPDHRNPVPSDTTRVGLVDGEQADPLAAAGADSLRANRTGLAEHPWPEAAAGQPKASSLPTTGLGSIGQGPADVLQRGTSSALLLMAQQTRSSGVADPARSARLATGTAPALAPATTADPSIAGGATPALVANRDLARPERPSATKSGPAGLAVGSAASSDNLSEPTLPTSGPPATKPPAPPATSGGLRDDALVTQSERPAQAGSLTLTNSPQNQAERLQESPTAAQAKSGSTGSAADPSTLQAAVSDVAAQPDIDIAGSDRFQSILATEGDPLRLERPDLPAASLASTRLPAAAYHPPASGQIALQIQHAASDGVDRVSLQLHPAELGSVDIELSFEGAGRISALITAERPETLELLQRDSRLLERSLGDSGLKLTGDGLSFALKQDQQQQQPGQNFQQQAEAREQASRAGRAYDDAADVEQTPQVRRIDGLRLLDIET